MDFLNAIVIIQRFYLKYRFKITCKKFKILWLEYHNKIHKTNNNKFLTIYEKSFGV